MSLVKTGDGVTDIRGSVGGVYFHRDKAGLHVARKPRVIYRRSSAQDLQRRAFAAARSLSTDNRIVSYLMYRYMNGLNINFPNAWTSPSSHSDPASKWSDPTRAYDDNEVTFAENFAADSDNYLELLMPVEVHCESVRILSQGLPGIGLPQDASIVIDVFYDRAWQNIHDGLVTLNVWVTLPFGVRKNTRRVRIKANPVLLDLFLYEFDFRTLNNPANNEPHVPVPIDYQIPRL